MSLTVDDFDFPLPPELIAQHPAPERTGSRLLHVQQTQLTDLRFAQIDSLLKSGDLLVFNDTKVIKARFFGRKASGGQVEVLLERIADDRHAIAQIRASKSPKPGMVLHLADDAFALTVTGRAGANGEFFALESVDRRSLWELAEAYGQLPLPPYIEHPPEGADETRYQTVYARTPGAVAAPTAGLHFDDALLDHLRSRGVGTAFLTLHVGAGTYQPVRVDKIEEHKMHSERFEIPAAYRHLVEVRLRYARWDLTRVDLIDARSGTILCPLRPLDKSANADGQRRALVPSASRVTDSVSTQPSGMAPLLRQLIAEYAATGLPPAYLPTSDKEPA